MEEVRMERKKPHAVMVPFPMQSHINSCLNLAKVLHRRGFCITFVNTEHVHNRLLQTTESMRGCKDFIFRTIPDGLPTSSKREVSSLWDSMIETCLPSLMEIITSSSTPVTSIISDLVMTFTLQTRTLFNIPVVFFSTINATSLLFLSHLSTLQSTGLIPVPDKSEMEREVDLIPGLRSVRLKDIWNWPIDPTDKILQLSIKTLGRIGEADAIAFNTFEELESDSIKALSSSPRYPPIYPIGPLPLILNQTTTKPESEPEPEPPARLNLWKESEEEEGSMTYECLKWLDTKEAGSVVYVNYGSNTVMTEEEVEELGWGMVGSGVPFLWVIREGGMVEGGERVLKGEGLVRGMGERGMVVRGWCRQERVLRHESVGGFMTHCGWNSISESICEGVVMGCWPCGGDQYINCRWACLEWGVGVEVEVMRREVVERVVGELMVGDGGRAMRCRALVLKKLAEAATSTACGSSLGYLDAFINDVLLSCHPK